MTQEVRLNGVVMRDFEPGDISWYQQRHAYEESASQLYRLIRAAGVVNFCDVGANYGLNGMLAARQGLRVLCIEADPRLIARIEANFDANELRCAAIVNAIAGASTDSDSYFCLNPSSSLDNRVRMPDWERVGVPTLRLTDVMRDAGFDRDTTFIKIDTQGYESRVIDGLLPLLQELPAWFIKMEFAPFWLESQGTVPLELLNSLLDRFEVVEYPSRIPYGAPSLESLFAHPLKKSDAADFHDYVVSLNGNRRGWVDLLLRQRMA